MSMPQYIIFGEALTDFIREADGRWSARAGGSCWNVARVGARLGVPSAFAGCVSKDLFGDELAHESLKAGLIADFLQRADHLPLLAMVPSANPPQYFFIGENSADQYFDPDLLPVGWLQAAKILHFGSLSLLRDPLSTTLVNLAKQAAAAGKWIAYDPNYRTVKNGRNFSEVLGAMAALADFIKVSDEDLAHIYPGMESTAALAALRERAPQAEILLTRGANGMTLLRGTSVYEQPVIRVPVVDTVGCGDAAMGAWMVSKLANAQAGMAATPEYMLRFIAAAAALTASHAGAYAPVREEVMKLLNQN